MNEPTQAIVRQVREDIVPQSADHWTRLVVCGLLLALGAFVIVRHPVAKPWDRGDLIIALAPIGAGLAIAFTGTMLAFVRAFPWPWGKKNDGPPPPAEAVT